VWAQERIGKLSLVLERTRIVDTATGSSAARQAATGPATTSPDSAIMLTRQFSLTPGVNTITVIAYDQHNNAASAPAALAVRLDVPSLPSLPAVSATSPAVISPAPPSSALALPESAVRQAATPLFHELQVIEVFDDRATQSGLETAFNEIARTIAAHDVFVLYLAGHGMTVDGRYYFLPQDFRYINEDAVRAAAISQDHLQRWLAAVPARKSLVLIDTCESGSFSHAMVGMRGMAEKTAIARLTRATGRATIVASTDSQPALEGYKGHGVFTYVLLEAFHQADAQFGNRDGYTGLFELAAYINDQVPAITMKAFQFEQIPQVHMLGTNFPIAMAQKVSPQ
jgi:hypothetical protein